MFRAQFAFDSPEPSVLPCAAGDQFTVLDSSNDLWWLVQNGNGQVGYVPASYLVADDVRIKLLSVRYEYLSFVNPQYNESTTKFI